VEAFRFTTWAADWRSGRVELGYALDDVHHFTESYAFPVPRGPEPSPVRRAALEGAVRLLHLVAGVSYFKTAVPPRIVIEGELPAPAVARYLGRLYTQGLGEFAWRNDLPRIGAGIVFPAGDEDPREVGPAGLVERSLVPVGGGKDSAVTLAALAGAGQDLLAFSVGHKPSSEATARIEGVPMLVVERSIDPLLFALNARGAYNGHVPITAIVSCAALVVALLHGCDAVVMSNERSASSGNFDWPEFGGTINHQFSKSWEAERALAEVVKGSVASDLRCFSLLRPYSELAISRGFAGLTRHHATFMSCNTGFRIREPTIAGWCGDCPKCRFVFLALAPFMDRPGLTAIFGADLLDDSAQEPGFRAILGIDAEKPFECVGEIDEARAALRAIAASPVWADDAIVARLAPQVGGAAAGALAPWLGRHGDHAIPPRHDRIIGAFLRA
jgi:hypothetical protein